MRFFKGERVALRNPFETATVIEDYGNGMILVEIDPCFRPEGDFDGLREIDSSSVSPAFGEHANYGVRFDFDVAWDGLRLERLMAQAVRHGVRLTKIIPEGPGGGNPNVWATAPDTAAARKFLADVYGCRTLQDIEDYVDPIINHEEA